MPALGHLPSAEISDFSGGLNTALEVHQLDPTEASVLHNLVVVSGGLRPRPALSTSIFVPILTPAAIEAGKRVLGFKMFRKSDGTRKALVAINNSGDTACKLYSFDWNGTTLGNQQTLTLTGGGALNLTASKTVQMEQYGDEVYIVNGSNAVHVHALGTTIADPITALAAPTVAPTVTQTDNAFLALSSNTSPNHWQEDTDTKWDVSVDSAETSVVLTASGTLSADAHIFRKEPTARNVDRSRFLVVEGMCTSSNKQCFLQLGKDSSGTPDWQADLIFKLHFPTANKWETFAMDLTTFPEGFRESILWVRFTRRQSIHKTDAFEMRFRRLSHSGGLDGEYDYAFTYFNGTTGQESGFARDADNNLLLRRSHFTDPRYRSAFVTVTGTAASGITKIRGYRRGGTRNEWYRIGQVNNPGASTVVMGDPWPDVWLGRSGGMGNFDDGTAANLAIFSATNNAAPPVASTLALRKERMWYNDIAKPNRAYMSDVANPRNVPRVNIFDDSASSAEGGFFEVGKNTRQTLIGFAPGERMLFFLTGSTHFFDGDTMRDALIASGATLLSGKHGARTSRSIAFGDFGVYVVGDRGALWTDGQIPPTPVGLKVGDQFVPPKPPASAFFPSLAAFLETHCLYGGGRYFVFSEKLADANTREGFTLVYDARRGAGQPGSGYWGRWTFPSGGASVSEWIVTAATQDIGPEGQDRVYLGLSDGAVYLLDETKNTRDRFVGGNKGIAYEYRSALLDFGESTALKDFVAVQLIGDFGSTAENVSVSLLDAGGTTLASKTIAVQGAGEQEIRQFASGVRATQVSIKIDGTRPSTIDQDFLIRRVRLWVKPIRGVLAS